jgi:tetratricopeptide (TPR) repeat protein
MDHDLRESQGPAYERALAAARAMPFEELVPHILPPTQIQVTVRPAIRELWDACYALCPTMAAMPAFLAVVDRWVQWDRDVGLAFAVGTRLVLPDGATQAAASLYVARALLHRNDDRWVTNLDHAVLLSAELSAIQPNVELLIAARHDYLSHLLAARRYADITPASAYPEHFVAAGELLGHNPELMDDTEALHRFIAGVPHDPLQKTLAGEVLGNVLGSRGEHAAAAQARTEALATAHQHGITTHIGHLHRQLGNGLIRQGLDAGHAGDATGREALLKQAAAVLEAAILFESAAGCEYWLAVTHYRLADAYRYLDDLPSATQAFEAALDAEARHFAEPGRYLDRAVKRIILESSGATAASFALGTGQLDLLVRQVAQDQSDTGVRLLAEMQAMHRLDDDMREAIAGTRAEDYFEAAAVREGYEAFRAYMFDRAAERFRADTGRGWVSWERSAEGPATLGAVRERLTPRTGVLAVTAYQNLSIALPVSRESQPLAAVSRAWTKGTAAMLQARFAESVAQARGLQPALSQRLLQRAVDELVEQCDRALGPFLDGVLPGDVDRLLLVVQRQARQLPWLAFRVNGIPLLEQAQVVHLESLSSLKEPAAVGSRTVAMVYDDIGAPGFEPLTADPQGLGIDDVLRHPEPRELLALAPLLSPGERTKSMHAGEDPLQGHFLIDVRELFGEDLPEMEPPVSEPVAKVRDVLFACHGVFDPADPLGSGLDLPNWPKRLSFADVLSSMDVRSWGCVVLAACESGLAQRELSQEEPGVASAFLAGGVDYVVSTLWPVDQLATTWWLEQFLRARGFGVPAASQAASLALRDLKAGELVAWGQSAPEVLRAAAEKRATTGERPFDHPFFWAPYVVSGTG